MRCVMMRSVGLSVAIVAWCLAGPAAAQKSDAKVKVKASVDKPGDQGRQTITLEVAIEPGWHIYANPVLSDYFKGGQTTLKAAGKAKLEKVEYPKGTRRKDSDPSIGEYAIYEGKITLKATVLRPAGEPLALDLRVMACSDEKMQCLLPGTVAIKIP